MKKPIILLLIICLTKTILAQDATNIYQNTVNSTVTIETDIMLGSGFFISKNVIVTNYHVIKGASEVYCCTNNSSTKFKIEGYLAVDKSNDLILLKVSGLDRTALKIATGSVTPGQKVYVIGSPKGLPASISDGIVSGLRDFEGHKLIQITAPISPGSSGGPVLNDNGEVIGVSIGQINEGQNLNFAIPKSNLESLLNLQTTIPKYITSLYDLKNSFTDQKDGQTYKTVKIGNQIWMAENLKTTKFNDGTAIPLVTDASSWEALTTPSYCWYNNDAASYKATYGALYNWYVVDVESNGGKNVCPKGWHVPSDAEWSTLTSYLGGDSIAGDKLKETGTTHWHGPKTDATNESGFTAVPGGYRYDNGKYYHVGIYGIWWSSTEYSTSDAWHMLMNLQCPRGNQIPLY
ncbi:MAG: FISUMP domain-containing protein [Bacteroidales bacterium]|jgi:uncharacterized protein (TIGR02145 family)